MLAMVHNLFIECKELAGVDENKLGAGTMDEVCFLL